jgi:hypothetical protein
VEACGIKEVGSFVIAKQRHRLSRASQCSSCTGAGTRRHFASMHALIQEAALAGGCRCFNFFLAHLPL